MQTISTYVRTCIPGIDRIYITNLDIRKNLNEVGHNLNKPQIINNITPFFLWIALQGDNSRYRDCLAVWNSKPTFFCDFQWCLIESDVFCRDPKCNWIFFPGKQHDRLCWMAIESFQWGAAFEIGCNNIEFLIPSKIKYIQVRQTFFAQ